MSIHFNERSGVDRVPVHEGARVHRNLPTETRPTLSNQPNNTSAPWKHSAKARVCVPFDYSQWWWWWEIGAILLNAVCICLIAVVLLVLHEKPLATWTLKVSPNGAISVLSTVGKSAIMLSVSACVSQLKWNYFTQPRSLRDLEYFDSASRGPWGSLIFLLRIRGKALGAALGAVVTVLALSYEPSVQQILSYPNRNVSTPDVAATIMRADRWRSKALTTMFTAFTGSSTLLFRIAVLEGLVGKDPGAMFECPTVRCEFPDFSSLAICSECEDITHTTVRNCSTLANEFGSSLQCIYTPEDSFFNPADVTLAQQVSPDDPGPWTHVYGLQGVLRSDTDVKGGFIAVNVTTPTEWVDSRFIAGDAVVHGCTWSFCSESYTHVAVDRGIVSYDSIQTPLIEVPNRSSGSDWAVWMGLNSTSKPLYTIEPICAASLWQLLGQAFTEQLVPSYLVNRTESDIPLYLWSKDLYGTVNNISRTVTNLISSEDNVQGTLIHGTSFTTQAYVQVRWSWLILPLCLTLAAIVLLAVSIFSRGQSGRTEPYKTSSLALLFHSLEEWREDEVRLTAKGDALNLDDVAKGMTMVLTEGGQARKRIFRVV